MYVYHYYRTPRNKQDSVSLLPHLENPLNSRQGFYQILQKSKTGGKAAVQDEYYVMKLLKNIYHMPIKQFFGAYIDYEMHKKKLDFVAGETNIDYFPMRELFLEISYAITEMNDEGIEDVMSLFVGMASAKEQRSNGCNNLVDQFLSIKLCNLYKLLYHFPESRYFEEQARCVDECLYPDGITSEKTILDFLLYINEGYSTWEEQVESFYIIIVEPFCVLHSCMSNEERYVN